MENLELTDKELQNEYFVDFDRNPWVSSDDFKEFSDRALFQYCLELLGKSREELVKQYKAWKE